MIPLKNNQIRNKKVIVIGTIFLDIKGYPEGKFDPSGRNAGRISYVHGGVGRNAAVDLAGLGCRPVFISMCEDDAFGKDIMANLKSCGLNTEYIINIPESTGLWMAVFDDNGDVYANISRRQDLRPLINVLEEHRDDLFSGTDAILIEMDANEELLEKTYVYASDYDIRYMA